jgi:hypothetical protein
VHDFLLRDLDDHVRVRARDGLEVALVEEDGVPEEAVRGVHEQLLARDRARHLGEDRLQAEALELEGHVRFVGHREEDVGPLQLASRRPADEGPRS